MYIIAICIQNRLIPGKDIRRPSKIPRMPANKKRSRDDINSNGNKYKFHNNLHSELIDFKREYI
jgi:hypothetical protein